MRSLIEPLRLALHLSVVLGGMLLTAAPARSAVLFVDGTAEGTGNGTSWQDAYVELPPALAAASSGDQVWVAAGTYLPSEIAHPVPSFVLSQGVELYGGFDGTESTLAERDWVANPTILSGDYGFGINSFHVVTADLYVTTPVIDGFTISGGAAPASAPDDFGGGVYVEWGNVELRNLVVENNLAATGGAGIHQDFGHLTLVDCTVRDNSGHGLQAISGTVQGCRFESNDGDGAVFSEAADVSDSWFGGHTTGLQIGQSGTITGCTFEGNDVGADVWSTTIDDSSFRDNRDHGVTLYGASTLSGAWVEDNDVRGVVVDNTGGDVLIENSVIRRNGLVAPGDRGGGLRRTGSANPSLLLLRNVLVDSNEALYDAAGMYVGGGQLLCLNVTVVRNRVVASPTSTSGGPLAESRGSVIRNSVFWDNVPAPPRSISLALPAHYDHSIVEGAYDSNGIWQLANAVDDGANASVDPEFVDPAGYFWLRPGSPGIDAGDDTTPELATTDLAGTPRVSGAGVDIGAYETGCAAQPVLFVSSEGTITGDGSSWATALPSLQLALGRACGAADEIWVRGGTYHPTLGADQDRSFELVDGVAVRGGFAGDETAIGERIVGAYPTILSGNIGNPLNAFDNSRHVVLANGTGPGTILEGVTVADGYAQSGGGAGLSVNSGSVSVRNTILQDNFTGTSGGAVRMFLSPQSEFLNCLFRDNAAPIGRAAALHAIYSNVLVANSTFLGNDADGPGVVALANGATDLQIVNSILHGNGDPGSAAVSLESPATGMIAHSIAEGSGGSGGGWPPTFGTDGGGNLDADPLFVDPLSGDAHLAPGSPAIDAGDDQAVGILAFDLEGNPRVLGDTVDMGAFESAVAVAAPALSRRADLPPNVPNPFNPRTVIHYVVPGDARSVSLALYDLRGRRVRTLLANAPVPGDGEVIWDGRDDAGAPVSSGAYVARLEADGVIATRKMLLLR